MDPLATATDITTLLGALTSIGAPLQGVLLAVAVLLATAVAVPRLRPYQGQAVALAAAVLCIGELVLAWFHWRLYALAVVVNPAGGTVSGHVAVPLWVESEKLYVWALIVALMALAARRHRDELLPGAALALAVLMAGAALWGKPFTEPLPSFLGQYGGYLSAMASGQAQSAFGAYQGMESARQYYYNTWYMWVHPPLLFMGYGAFTMSFIATIEMLRTRFSAYEVTAYRWMRLGYLPLTGGMLLGFPWAIMAWSGESWWWSGKVNMSIMMWLLYTACLHARLYVRRRGVWKWVAALSVLSFIILVLTYLATYVVPGAHSYA